MSEAFLVRAWRTKIVPRHWWQFWIKNETSELWFDGERWHEYPNLDALDAAPSPLPQTTPESDTL